MKSILINLFTAVILAFALISCSDLQDDVVVSPDKNSVSIHGEGALNKSSQNFHGKYFATADFDNCRTCHGVNLAGAATEASCVKCHTAGVQVHKEGILDAASSNFHAVFFHGNYAALASCKSCHSDNNSYRGSAYSPSCADAGCHESSSGPESCSTCHSTSRSMNPWKDLAGNTETTYPGVGAHKAHLTGGVVGVKVADCYACHKHLDNGVFSESHLDNSDGAELTWGELAIQTTDVNNIKPSPVYDYENHTCANTYCHGYFKNGNKDNVVSWTAADASSQVKCGSCHGDPVTGNPLPKGNHVKLTDCEDCHGDVVEESGDVYVIKDFSKHMNGKLNVYGQEIDF